NNSPISVFWFRRDLRLEDNAGLYHALKSGLPVMPIFIFDSEILKKLENKEDKRVEFIHQQLAELKTQLNQIGSDLQVYFGKPKSIWVLIANNNDVAHVFT